MFICKYCYYYYQYYYFINLYAYYLLKNYGNLSSLLQAQKPVN